MALIKCPECGRDNVSNTAEMCPNCGYGIRLHFEKLEQEKHQAELRKKEEQNNIVVCSFIGKNAKVKMHRLH